MISELFLAAILSTSFSVRTPNDTTQPLDYEFSVKAENKEGNFTYNIKRDWERELGNKYIDDIFNFNQNIGVVYGGLDYVDKQSKDINYTTYNLGLNHKSGLKIGLSVKEDTPLLNVGLNKKLKKENLEYNIGLSFKSNFDDSDIYNIKSEVKKWFGKFNIFGLYKHEYYNEKEDFQFKVGVGIQL
jgi:hypothetical protein